MAKKKSVRKPKPTVSRCVDTGDIEGMRALAAAGVDLNKINRGEELSPLSRAIELGNLEMVRELLALGHDPNWGGIVHPLARAVCEGNRPMVNLLLEKGAAIDGEEEEGDTAFMYAAGRGHIDLVKQLLDAGADLTHKNREGRDALDFAAGATSQEMLDFSLPRFPKLRQDTVRRQTHLIRERRHKAETTSERKREEDSINLVAAQPTSDQLIRAFCNGKHKAFLKLLASGADPNEVNDEGTTLLAMLCASWSGVDLVETTLEAGADPNRPSKFIPLQMAAAVGVETVVQALLNAGADVHARSESASTALISAAGSGQIEAVQVLLDAGADPNAEDSEGRSAYRKELERNNHNIADLLRPLTRDIEGAERPWRANKAGQSLERRLFAAAEAGDVEYVRKFLAEGVSPDIANESHYSPLQLAAENGHVEVICVLIDAGAPVDVAGCRGWTPLFNAIRAGKIEAVRCLVDAGADTSILDSDGRDVIAFAKAYRRGEVAELLSALRQVC